MQSRNGAFDKFGHHFVVGIEEGDVGSIQMVETGISGTSHTLIVLPQIFNVWMSGRKASANICGLIGASVIHDDDPLRGNGLR